MASAGRGAHRREWPQKRSSQAHADSISGPQRYAVAPLDQRIRLASQYFLNEASEGTGRSWPCGRRLRFVSPAAMNTSLFTSTIHEDAVG
jgi:hypothetical protein